MKNNPGNTRPKDTYSSNKNQSLILPELLYNAVSTLKEPKRTRICYIYDSIAQRTLTQHKSQQNDEDLLQVAFNANHWNNALDCKKQTIYNDLNFLTRCNLIECDGLFIPGNKSKWYMPTVEAVNSTFIEVALRPVKQAENLKTKTGKAIIKNIHEIRLDSASALRYLRSELIQIKLKNRPTFKNENNYWMKKRPQFHYSGKIMEVKCNIYSLCSNLASFPLYPSFFPFPSLNKKNGFSEKNDFDSQVTEFTIKATNYLVPEISRLARALLTDKENSLLKAKYHELASFLYSIRKAYDLHFRNFTILKSDTNDRIHHTIVESPRSLRKYFYNDTHEIIDVDLANSQPAIIVGVMLKDGLQVEKSLLEAVKTGRYYKVLQSMAGLNISYDELKKLCLRFLYSQASTNLKEVKQPGIAKAFNQLWPNAFNWIIARKEKLNRPHKKNKKSKKGNQLFAIEMQKKEAKWMINHVLTRLSRANKSLWFVPMHDGSLISKQHAERLQRIMEEEFNKLFGFKPTIKTKEL